MNHEHHLPFILYSKRFGRCGIKNLVDLLDLQEMVSRTKRTNLGYASVFLVLLNLVWIGVFHAPIFLAVFSITWPA